MDSATKELLAELVEALIRRSEECMYNDDGYLIGIICRNCDGWKGPAWSSPVPHKPTCPIAKGQAMLKEMEDDSH